MVGAKQQDPHGGQSYQGSGSFAFRKQAGRGITRIEKIIVVVLCLLPRGTHGRLARQPIRAAGKDDGVPADPATTKLSR